MVEVPPLKIQIRPGTYARGLETVEQILRAALQIMVDEGYRALTLRRIAEVCNMKVGNVTYYFPNKDLLVREMIDSVLNSYEEVFDSILNDLSRSPEERLKSVIRLILDDIQTKKTTNFFPELWALSNYDAVLAERVDNVYRRARGVLNQLIPLINPRLSEGEREVVALYISASLEGTTIFAGYNKPWAHQMPQIENIAIKALVDMVRSITSEDIWKLQDNAETFNPIPVVFPARR
ncbi:TetR/AcrR family transcriptional regulator [Govanella unica]|uniref:TetR/AcrR family transcriptional regulator n=1 Tax=Govanella unica TaxID=2975056 RepID=A0A9X3U0G0_9PROT|nr:TetR/AcrR family transcriptional regulator [Govania unica]MDA5195056.1 TetR/AcrR family transcriptional regulator [Govania unica]